MYIKTEDPEFGAKIEFPTLLLKELVSIHLRNERRADKDAFNFVFRGHTEGKTAKELKAFNFPEDNTPEALVGKKTSEIPDVIKFLHLSYIRNFGGFKRFYENILIRAIRKSKLDPDIIKLACNQINYKPGANCSKVYQHLFQLAAHAGFLGQDKNEYVSFVHNNYIQILRKTKSYRSLKLGLENQDTFHLAKIYKSQYKEYDNGILGVLARTSTAGNTWQRITVTAPANFHPSSESWDGCSPRDTRQIYFQKRWRKIQDLLNKNKIKISGFWTIEFHKDGCPHMNFFVISSSVYRNRVIEVFRNYFEHSPHSMDIRMDIQDTGKNAVNKNIKYITKYLFPAVNNSKQHRELFDRSMASIFDIRLYGFFGM